MNTYLVTQTVVDGPWSGTHYTYLVKASNEQEARNKLNSAIPNDLPRLDEYDSVEQVKFVKGIANTGSFSFGD